LRELKHPLKKEIEMLRRIILGVSPEIREGIKWNAPSFRTSEWFATFNLHARDCIRLILHAGARKKEGAGLKVPDPAGLLEWRAKDRCMATFGNGKDIQSSRADLQAILREWIRQL
jgi:hypothetical protein